ncbi:insulinase family protein [Pseudoalteromonas viridis]|uniref:Insulinase family protein n=1 Tax=Pseudoalteromonas viridis TaxID=339617 RepID=A0ABX7V6D6_9GAMM|nr:insulinase family protein [Pseudoalteromonas viridis]QTL36461.1 insulinase family protein [Pseudoalteromonas viridis]
MNLSSLKNDWQFEHGLSLTYRHYPQYPIASISINVLGAGEYQESVYQQSHLLEHLVYMAMKPRFSNEPDVYMSAQTNLESAQYTCRLPASKVTSFINCFERATQDPDTFSSEMIKREKQAVKNELSKPVDALNKMLPLLGWAQGVQENWPAFDALDDNQLASRCQSAYVSHKIHIEVAGNLSTSEREQLILACTQLDRQLQGYQDKSVGTVTTMQANRLVVSEDKRLVGYFCDLPSGNVNTYLMMACAYHLFHAPTNLSLYHKLRFEKGHIYNLIRSYHLFDGRGQFALFAQVQPESCDEVVREVTRFFSQDGAALLDEYLPWAAKKCLSSQMLFMETLSEVTKRASQYYVNFHRSMDEADFYQYLQPGNLNTVFTDIQNNFFNQKLEVVGHD